MNKKELRKRLEELIIVIEGLDKLQKLYGISDEVKFSELKKFLTERFHELNALWVTGVEYEMR